MATNIREVGSVGMVEWATSRWTSIVFTLGITRSGDQVRSEIGHDGPIPSGGHHTILREGTHSSIMFSGVNAEGSGTLRIEV